MKIRVFWDNDDQTIIRWDFNANWDWNEFYAAATRSVELRQSKTHDRPVSIVLNIGATAPTLGGALNATHNSIMLKTAGRGLIIIVGQHKLTQRLAAMFAEAYADLDSPMTVCRTLEEAYQQIEKFEADHV